VVVLPEPFTPSTSTTCGFEARARGSPTGSTRTSSRGSPCATARTCASFGGASPHPREQVLGHRQSRDPRRTAAPRARRAACRRARGPRAGCRASARPRVRPRRWPRLTQQRRRRRRRPAGRHRRSLRLDANGRRRVGPAAQTRASANAKTASGSAPASSGEQDPPVRTAHGRQHSGRPWREPNLMRWWSEASAARRCSSARPRLRAAEPPAAPPRAGRPCARSRTRRRRARLLLHVPPRYAGRAPARDRLPAAAATRAASALRGPRRPGRSRRRLVAYQADEPSVEGHLLTWNAGRLRYAADANVDDVDFAGVIEDVAQHGSLTAPHLRHRSLERGDDTYRLAAGPPAAWPPSRPSRARWH
jgi:hypothetical protein